MNPILNKMGANANEQKKLLMECVQHLPGVVVVTLVNNSFVFNGDHRAARKL